VVRIAQGLAPIVGDPFRLLSAREREVAGFLVVGQIGPQIAPQLGVSVKTVDTHRMHILKKMQLENTVQLTLAAIRWGHLVIGREEDGDPPVARGALRHDDEPGSLAE
jgi:DNA-binding NarL/FixJ family response regulator